MLEQSQVANQQPPPGSATLIDSTSQIDWSRQPPPPMSDPFTGQPGPPGPSDDPQAFSEVPWPAPHEVFICLFDWHELRERDCNSDWLFYSPFAAVMGSIPAARTLANISPSAAASPSTVTSSCPVLGTPVPSAASAVRSRAVISPTRILVDGSPPPICYYEYCPHLVAMDVHFFIYPLPSCLYSLLPFFSFLSLSLSLSPLFFSLHHELTNKRHQACICKFTAQVITYP
jgi:hypothetical protein